MTANMLTHGQWDMLRNVCEIRQGDLLHASVTIRVYDSELPQTPTARANDIHSSCLQELKNASLS
jgi:hypothetical protein